MSPASEPVLPSIAPDAVMPGSRAGHHNFALGGGVISLTPLGGAGENRTPVHQALHVRATTIPDSSSDAEAPAGRMATVAGGPRIVFPNRHRSFPTSAVFSAVIPRFCCRAAVDRPRAPFLVTMSLHNLMNQAARANCSLAILVVAPFSESEQLGSHARTDTLTSKPVSPWLR